MKEPLKPYKHKYEASNLLHPRICVLVNNISRNPPEKYQENNSSNSEQEDQNSEVSITKFINEYKKQLIESQFKYYGEKLDEAFITTRINKLLPEENFYFYKRSPFYTKEQKEKELNEIRKLIKDSIASPQLFVKNGQIEPVHLD